MENKYLLQEDDCAPDATEAFIEQMKNKFNLNFSDFINKGTFSRSNDLTMEWAFSGFILSYHGDDPFYKLEKETER